MAVNPPYIAIRLYVSIKYWCKEQKKKKFPHWHTVNKNNTAAAYRNQNNHRYMHVFVLIWSWVNHVNLLTFFRRRLFTDALIWNALCLSLIVLREITKEKHRCRCLRLASDPRFSDPKSAYRSQYWAPLLGCSQICESRARIWEQCKNRLRSWR